VDSPGGLNAWQTTGINSFAIYRKTRSDPHPFDKQIDSLVYDLYGLTKDEIAIVEGSSI